MTYAGSSPALKGSLGLKLEYSSVPYVWKEVRIRSSPTTRSYPALTAEYFYVSCTMDHAFGPPQH
jgi:hypothetical protein